MRCILVTVAAIHWLSVHYWLSHIALTLNATQTAHLIRNRQVPGGEERRLGRVEVCVAGERVRLQVHVDHCRGRVAKEHLRKQRERGGRREELAF